MINSKQELNGKSMTQKDWIVHFNREGAKMISAPDVYRAITEQPEVLEALRKSFRGFKVLVTSTHITYDENDLSATITHDHQSTIVRPKSVNLKEIRDLSGDDFDQNDELYLQSLFDTKDKFDVIMNNLKILGENRAIRLWTPTQDSRNDYPERSVRLYFYGARSMSMATAGSTSICGVSFRVLSDSEAKPRNNEKITKLLNEVEAEVEAKLAEVKNLL